MKRENLINRIMADILKFALEDRFRQERESAKRRFLGIHPDRPLESVLLSEKDEKNFLLWFVIEYSSIVERWMEGRNLSPEVALLLEKIKNSSLALYKIVEEISDKVDELGQISEGDERREGVSIQSCNQDPRHREPVSASIPYLVLEDILSAERRLFCEPVITLLKDKPLLWGLRLIEWGEINYSLGDQYVFPLEIQEDIKDFLHRHIQGHFEKEMELSAFIPRGAGYILQHLRQTLQFSDNLQREMKGREKSREREKIHRTSAHYWVENFEASIEEIQKLPNITFLGEEQGYRFYEWYRDPALAGKDDPQAGIVLSRRKLVVHAFKQEDLESVKSLFRTILRKNVEYLYDTLVKRKV